MIVGVAILLFGRKLFWLFVAALGFAVGLEIAAYFMREPPVWMTLLIALGLGLLGALLAIMLQKLAIAVAGFIAGDGSLRRWWRHSSSITRTIAESLSSSAESLARCCCWLCSIGC